MLTWLWKSLSVCGNSYLSTEARRRNMKRREITDTKLHCLILTWLLKIVYLKGRKHPQLVLVKSRNWQNDTAELHTWCWTSDMTFLEIMGQGNRTPSQGSSNRSLLFHHKPEFKLGTGWVFQLAMLLPFRSFFTSGRDQLNINVHFKL